MRWKWIPIILFSIVIIVIVAFYILLSSYDFNRLKPRIEEAAFAATGRELKLIGDIELEIGFTPALVVEDVSFANAGWGARPDLATVKRFEVEVALLPLIGGNISIKRLVLIEPDILIETNGAGKSNLKFDKPKKREARVEREKAPADGEQGLPPLEVGELLIERGRLTYIDGKTGKSSLVLLNHLRASGAAFTSVLTLDIKGSLNANPFTVSGRFDSLAKLTDPGKGKVNISALKLKLGKNEITGNVGVDISSKIPRVVANLSAGNLDLREPSKKSGGKTGEEQKKKPKRKKVFPSGPLPVDSLKGVNLDLSFKAKRIILPALALNDLELKVNIKNGRLKIKPLTAIVGGGALSVNIDVRPKGKAVSLDSHINIDALDLATMGKELKVTEMLNGIIDVDIRAKGTGSSIAAIMASLNGSKRVVMGRGKIDNKFLKFMGGDLGTNVLKLLNPLAQREDYTVVNCMVVGFDITDGIAKSNAIIFDTSYMSVLGKGRINLKNEKLDISLNPNPKRGLGGGALGKLTLSLGELARAFRLGGTLANPRLAIDKSQTMMTIGKVIGGQALLGPAGLATALVGKSKGDENPCLSALEAEKNSAPAPVAVEKKKSVDMSEIPVPKEFKEVGEGLMKLFGK